MTISCKGSIPTGTATPANVVDAFGLVDQGRDPGVGRTDGRDGVPNDQSSRSARATAATWDTAAPTSPERLHVGSGAPFLWVQNNVNVLGQGSTKLVLLYTINGNSGSFARDDGLLRRGGRRAAERTSDLKVTIGANVIPGEQLQRQLEHGGHDAARPHEPHRRACSSTPRTDCPHPGTVQVDVIGFNDPGGLNYSLVVVGDVASASGHSSLVWTKARTPATAPSRSRSTTPSAASRCCR